MRSVWRQTARPRLSCNAAPRESVKSALARRTATSPLRQQVTFSDVFAFCLAPFLAAATIVDVSWKDKKRKDWDRRLAEINQELEELHTREVEIWTRLQYQSVRRGAMQQRRLYHAAAAAVQEQHVPERENTKSEDFTSTVANSIQIADSEQPDLWQDRNSSRIVQIEKLLAVRLALQLILHVHIGHETYYPDIYRNRRFEETQLPDNVGTMIKKLRDVNAQLDRLGKAGSEFMRAKVWQDLEYCSDGSPLEIQKARAQIVALGTQFRNGDIGVSRLVAQAAELLLRKGQKYAGPFIYAELLELFSLNQLDGLAQIVLFTLQNTGYVLTSNHICTVIEHASMTKNIKAYEWFLNEFTQINGRLALNTGRWEWWRVSGTLIPVPSKFDPRLYRSLIRSSLVFDQVHRAEAWTAVLHDYDYQGEMRSFVLKAFLQFCARTADWNRGQAWLKDTFDFILDGQLGQQQGDLLQLSKVLSALCFRALEVFVGCGRQQTYTELLNALVAAGLEPPLLDERTRFRGEVAKDIVSEWDNLLLDDTAGRRVFHEESFQRFQDFLRSLQPSLSPYNHVSLVSPVETQNLPSSSNFSEQCAALFEKHETALADIKFKLAGSQSLHFKVRGAQHRAEKSKADMQHARWQPHMDLEVLESRMTTEHNKAQAARVDHDLRLETLEAELRRTVDSVGRQSAEQDSTAQKSLSLVQKIRTLERQLAEHTKKEEKVLAQAERIETLERRLAAQAKKEEEVLAQAEKIETLEQKLAELTQFMQSHRVSSESASESITPLSSPAAATTTPTLTTFPPRSLTQPRHPGLQDHVRNLVGSGALDAQAFINWIQLPGLQPGGPLFNLNPGLENAILTRLLHHPDRSHIFIGNLIRVVQVFQPNPHAVHVGATNSELELPIKRVLSDKPRPPPTPTAPAEDVARSIDDAASDSGYDSPTSTPCPRVRRTYYDRKHITKNVSPRKAQTQTDETMRRRRRRAGSGTPALKRFQKVYS